ncbi:hypothetical protein IWX76_000384 [Pedobacter sp. CAN_A7]
MSYGDQLNTDLNCLSVATPICPKWATALFMALLTASSEVISSAIG